MTLEEALDLIDDWYDGIITDPRGSEAFAIEVDREAIMQAVERKAFANLARGVISSGGSGGGITQSQVTAAIQAAADIDTLITRLTSIDNKTGAIGSVGYKSSATITRDANTTQYIANDVYGSTFELANFSSANSFVILESVSLIFEIATLPVGMGAFSLFLYDAAPSAISDNAAFSISAGDKPIIYKPEGIYLGTAKLAIGGGGCVVLQADNINQSIRTTTSSAWGRLVAHSGFTPAAASETATISASCLGV